MELKCHFLQNGNVPEKHGKLSGFRTKFWDSTKRITRKVLKPFTAIALAVALALGCGEDKTEKRPRFEETGILVTPFDGKLLKDENGSYYMANRLVIGFDNERTNEEVLALFQKYNGKITGIIPQLNIYEVEIEGNLDEIIAGAGSNTGVSFAERNYFAESTATLDNDSYQGEGADGLWWSKVIQLSEAYQYLENSNVKFQPTTVAVLDSSFDLEISELKNQYVPKISHWDVGDNDNDVSNKDMWLYVISSYIENRGKGIDLGPVTHGTQVAGIVAADNNDGIINGIAYEARIFPLKLWSKIPPIEKIEGWIPTLLTDEFKTAAALTFVGELKKELDISAVNMSFGFKKGMIPGVPINVGGKIYFINALEMAVDSLYSKGVVLIAAAGNENTDSSEYYPCAYPKVICVGGTEMKNGIEQRYGSSNFSADVSALTLAAPAKNILTVVRLPSSFLDQNSEYNEAISVTEGTSFASPIVAGTVALLRSIDPTITPDAMLQLLRDTADDIETDKGTWKRVNVYKAVKKVVGVSERTNNGCSLTAELELEPGDYITDIYGDYALIDASYYSDEGEHVVGRWRLLNMKTKVLEEINLPTEIVPEGERYRVAGIWENNLVVAVGDSLRTMSTCPLFLYNFKSEDFKNIGEGQNATLGNGTIVFHQMNLADAPLAVYNIETGETKVLEPLPDGLWRTDYKSDMWVTTETASPKGAAVAISPEYAGDDEMLLVNNFISGGWKQIADANGYVDLKIYGNWLAFMQDGQQLKTYDFTTDVVEDLGINADHIRGMWGTRVAYTYDYDKIAVFDIATKKVKTFDISGMPFLYGNTLTIAGNEDILTRLWSCDLE